MSLLLDTHALIWLAQGVELRPETVALLNGAADDAEVHVSVVSAWEVGLLASRHRVAFAPDPKTWFAKALRGPGLRLADLSPEIAIDSSQLPGAFHQDPADRLLVSTARHHGMTLVTRDRRILAYAQEGHLEAIAC